MSSVVKKEAADKTVFKHSPKSFRVATSVVAKEFVNLQTDQSSDFEIAEVVAQQAGVTALRKKNVEAQVEETVLERLKEIEEQGYRQAYDLGLIEGKETAFNEAKADFAKRLIELDSLLSEIHSIKTHILKESEAVLVKLVFQIAEKMAMRTITYDQEPVADMLRTLVAEVESSDQVNIKLNPRDFQFIEELRLKKVKEVENLERVKLTATPDITVGGCVIETNFGTIDASVEQRVEKAWALIEAKLPKIAHQAGDKGT